VLRGKVAMAGKDTIEARIRTVAERLGHIHPASERSARRTIHELENVLREEGHREDHCDDDHARTLRPSS
jgi:hypothetical protein